MESSKVTRSWQLPDYGEAPSSQTFSVTLKVHNIKHLLKLEQRKNNLYDTYC